MTFIVHRMKLCAVGLLVLFIGSHGLADEDKRFAKNKILFESTMKTPESMKGWKMEGQGTVDFRDGWLHMFSPKEKMHHVYWCPETFPSSFIAEWEVQNMETDAGLCIVFFAAKGENGEDIFDPTLPERNGDFKQYTRGMIVSYHISYYANAAHNPDRGHANLRKNNKFILVHEGKTGIPTKSTKAHKLRLIKDGPHIVMFVDDRKIIEWTDDGKTHGLSHTNGKIGFRQMKWTHFRYRNFRVWALRSKQMENAANRANGSMKPSPACMPTLDGSQR